MKNKFITIIITTIIFLACATACKKDDPIIVSEYGTNIVTCKINGQSYTSKGGKPTDNPWMGCQTGNYIYSSALGGVNYLFDFSFCIQNFQHEMQMFIVDSLKENKYILGSTFNKVHLSGAYYKGSTNNSNIGVFEITSLTEHRIMGKFNFNIHVIDSPYVANITDGVFNLAR
jgi:hypothetical protein